MTASAALRWARCATLGAAVALATGLPARAQESGPLSAIDWLRRSTAESQPGAWPITPPTNTQEAGAISVRALDALRPEAVGLFPAARVGLPTDLWGATPAGDLAALIADLPVDMLPALRDLALRLLLAEFDAPLPDLTSVQGEQPDFLLARIDKLIEFGALDQAAAILDALGPDNPALRLRRFDIGLLLGDEHRACDGVLQPTPPIGDESALIFCLARERDWQAAEERLARAELAGSLPAYEAELLAHFLHDDRQLSGSATLMPPPPGPPSPLVWRLREAAGDPVGTLGLPVAFAHADLRGTAGWRAQIEAAERLVRVGALSPNRLLGLYTERRAAASGGIWERVRAVHALDAALREDDRQASAEALVAAWPEVQAGELEVAIANLYALPLGQMRLAGSAGALAFRVGLLSDDYETVALGLGDALAGPEERFLAAVARGLDPAAAGSMAGDLAPAVAQAFGPDPAPPPGLRERLSSDRLGEEILRVLVLLGGPGDPRLLGAGLTTLRLIGLEDIARRTALESLLLERRG